VLTVFFRLSRETPAVDKKKDFQMKKPHRASAGVIRSVVASSQWLGAATIPLAGRSRAAPAASMPIKAVAVDAFPIFDQRSIFAA
jgi:hypothetical protein